MRPHPLKSYNILIVFFPTNIFQEVTWYPGIFFSALNIIDIFTTIYIYIETIETSYRNVA